MGVSRQQTDGEEVEMVERGLLEELLCVSGAPHLDAMNRWSIAACCAIFVQHRDAGGCGGNKRLAQENTRLNHLPSGSLPK